METGFVRHEPCYDRILFVLTLDRKKMKERILIGEELQVRFRLQGDKDADVLCDATRPLGTFLADFEHDPDGEWNRFGLAPLREALHSNRWKQPALERAAGDFLQKKFDSDIGRPEPFHISSRIFGSVPAEETRLDLWYPDNRRTTECVLAYATFYPLITYYLNRLDDWGCASENVKSAGIFSLQQVNGMSCAATSAERSRRFKISGSLTRGQEKTTMICSTKTSARTGATRSTGQRKQPAFRLIGWKKCWLLLIVSIVFRKFNSYRLAAGS